MIFKTLYKKTSVGDIQVWWMEVEDDKYRTYSGKYNGRIVVSAWTVATPKNVGRSNATSAMGQAEQEVASAYELKIKGGYRDTIEGAMDSGRFQCMLAKKFEDYSDKVQAEFERGNSVFVQPKLDGIRCIATRNGLFSRQGNPIVAVPHIEEAVKRFFLENPEILTLDGELYNHEFHEDFNSIISMVKKTKPTENDLLESEKMIQYWVYDCLHKNSDAVFSARHNWILSNGPIRKLETYKASNMEEVNSFYDQFLSEGFEGMIIRINKPYETKRTHNLLKRKEFQDSEFTILDIQEGSGNGSGMAKRAILDLGNGKTFKADIVGTQQILREYLRRRSEFIGKQATVVFQNLTPDGVPRFPKFKVGHDTERW